jgi:hypothetical protein
MLRHSVRSPAESVQTHKRVVLLVDVRRVFSTDSQASDFTR